MAYYLLLSIAAVVAIFAVYRTILITLGKMRILFQGNDVEARLTTASQAAIGLALLIFFASLAANLASEVIKDLAHFIIVKLT